MASLGREEETGEGGTVRASGPDNLGLVLPSTSWTLQGFSVQALLPLALEGTDVGQTKAAQALAKLTITSNPEMTFPGERVRVFLPQPWPLLHLLPHWALMASDLGCGSFLGPTGTGSFVEPPRWGGHPSLGVDHHLQGRSGQWGLEQVALTGGVHIADL